MTFVFLKLVCLNCARLSHVISQKGVFAINYYNQIKLKCKKVACNHEEMGNSKAPFLSEECACIIDDDESRAEAMSPKKFKRCTAVGRGRLVF